MKRQYAFCLFDSIEQDIQKDEDTCSLADSTKQLAQLNRVLHQLRESIELFKGIGAVWGEALCLLQQAMVFETAIRYHLLANVAPELKEEVPSADHVRAEMKKCYKTALDRFRQIDHHLGVAVSANSLAEFIKEEK